MMNRISMTARIIGAPHISTGMQGTPKVTLTVETDGGDLPLRYTILFYGQQAQTASELLDGDTVFLTGRVTASAMSRTTAIIANGLEFLYASGEEADGTESISEE